MISSASANACQSEPDGPASLMSAFSGPPYFEKIFSISGSAAVMHHLHSLGVETPFGWHFLRLGARCSTPAVNRQYMFLMASGISCEGTSRHWPTPVSVS
jgi:hypothetical protein